MLLWLLACTEPVPEDPLTVEALEAATRAVTDLGPRLAGSPAEEEARVVVEQLLRDAGLEDVRSEPFTWDAWQPGPASVTVGARVLPAEPLSPSPPRSGLVVDLARDEVAGKAALRFASEGSRALQYPQALFEGAAALVRVTDWTDEDGAGLVEVGHTLAGATMPAVAVDAEAGEILLDAVGSSVTLDVESAVVEDHVSHNVLGQVTGRTDDTVYVTAHYDSWHPSESAFDNGLGVGALAVLAAKLASGPTPERTVVFLAPSAEEQGLVGSTRWVEEHGVDDAVFVLNLDVLWAAEGSYWIGSTDEHWRERALELAAEEGIDARDGGTPGLASDHTPFAVRGVPAMWNSRWPDRHYHTTRDTLDELDLDEAMAAVRLHWRVLAELAGQ